MYKVKDIIRPVPMWSSDQTNCVESRLLKRWSLQQYPADCVEQTSNEQRERKQLTVWKQTGKSDVPAQKTNPTAELGQGRARLILHIGVEQCKDRKQYWKHDEQFQIPENQNLYNEPKISASELKWDMFFWPCKVCWTLRRTRPCVFLTMRRLQCAWPWRRHKDLGQWGISGKTLLALLARSPWTPQGFTKHRLTKLLNTLVSCALCHIFA